MRRGAGLLLIWALYSKMNLYLKTTTATLSLISTTMNTTLPLLYTTSKMKTETPA